VALGFDHVVANMFFLPLAMWQHVAGVSLAHVVTNLLLALAGNAVGAGLFVAGGYWYLYLQGRPAPVVAPAQQTPNGRAAAEPQRSRTS
jgi:formate/nitrite transporter FocA (FNT family)